MRIHCEWIDGSGQIYCANTGDQILIFGCIEGHIGEHIFCLDHICNWEEMAADSRAWCAVDVCDHRVADWITISIRNGLISWLHQHQKEWAG